MAKQPIPFFTDNCVPNSVGDAIAAAGHPLFRLREHMAGDSEDRVIAVACAENGHVLVTLDNDFKAIAKRLQVTQGQYRKLLHRIDLHCDENLGAQRIKEAMSIIEHEWLLVCKGGRDFPMVIQISNVAIRILR